MNDAVIVRLLLLVIAVVILLMLINEYNKQRRHEAFTSVDVAPPRQQRATTVERATFGNQPPALTELLEQSTVAQSSSAAAQQTTALPTQTLPSAAQPAGVMASEELNNEDYRAVDFPGRDPKIPTGCFPQDETRVEDLLPKDAANSLWAQVNPAGQGDVSDQNFLTAGYHIGVDTIGQSRKNPNYGIRSEPPNPRVNVSIWNNSSIEYDSNRRPFELGSC